MVGKFKVAIITKDVQYKLSIDRNITVIRGNSATGKTYLCELINRYNQGEKSAISVKVQSEVEGQNVHCEVLTSIRWMENLKLINNAIVFIDEDSKFIFTNEFKQMVEGSSNYYVIISRHIDGLENIPFSVNSVCEFTESKYISNKRAFTINTLKPLWYLKSSDSVKISRIVTEDSKSGYQFYRHICGENDCQTADGKSNLPRLILHNRVPTLFIADGSAFGSNTEKIIQLARVSPDALLYLPESFEWFLLHSLVFAHDSNVQEVLEDTSKFVDSAKYISWERFFTDYLKKVCSDKGFQYGKSETLDRRFLEYNNVKHLLHLVQNVDFSKWIV